MQEGKTIHFAPRGGIYAWFRIYEDEIVTVILNKSDITEIESVVVEEIGLSGKKVKDVITGKEMDWGEMIKINPNSFDAC